MWTLYVEFHTVRVKKGTCHFERLYKGWMGMELFTVLLRTIFIYFFVLLIMRLMGKREIGKLSVFDLVVSIMIAELAVVSIEDTEVTLVKGMIPIVTLMLTQVFMSFISLKSSKIRDFLEGTPSILIKNGEIQEKEMAKHRYNMADLLLQLREKNVEKVADVEFAVLETSGKLSVIPKESQKPLTKGDLGVEARGTAQLPVPLIVDGKVQDEGLSEIGKTRNWLKNEVQKRGYKDFRDIFFAVFHSDGTLHIDRKQP